MRKTDQISAIKWGNTWYSDLSSFIAAAAKKNDMYGNRYGDNLESGVLVVHGGECYDATKELVEIFDNAQRPLVGNKEMRERIKNLFRAELFGFPITPRDSWSQNQMFIERRRQEEKQKATEAGNDFLARRIN